MKVKKFPLPIPRDFNASNAKGGGTRLVSANWRNIILREGKLYYLREEVVIESAKVDGKPQDGEQEEVKMQGEEDIEDPFGLLYLVDYFVRFVGCFGVFPWSFWYHSSYEECLRNVFFTETKVLEWVEVPHLLGNGLIVCLYGLGQSSSHELAFGVELGPGEAVYVDDIPSPPNCLHGAFIYSTKPLAGVKGIQLESNRLSDGVNAIITFTDIPSGGANVGGITTFGPSPYLQMISPDVLATKLHLWYDVINTNIAKSLNLVLLDERECPLSHIFNSIDNKFGEKFGERHAFVDGRNNKFVPCAEKILRDNKSMSDSIYVTHANGGLDHFMVFDNGVTTKVNLLERSCSCRKFNLVKMPCEHAMATLREKYANGEGYGNSIYEYSSAIYKAKTYLLAYSEAINVVPPKAKWTVPQELQDTNISPPLTIPNSEERKSNPLRTLVRHSSPKGGIGI
ncbi:hypothetical protein FXO38_01843 [Capsicum annuum]|nr:hypothetical protein FXO38_01843 [Capsicum annuum]